MNLAITPKDQLSDPLHSALAESDRLQEENARLRRLLLEHNIPVAVRPVAAAVSLPEKDGGCDTKSVTNQIKDRVALFRSLFRGREDVYAVRWEGSDGRSGYMPKSDRDWKAYNASKPEDRKKTDRKTRKLWPLTDQAVEDHLRGRQTIGIYPAATGRDLLVSRRGLRQKDLATGRPRLSGYLPGTGRARCAGAFAFGQRWPCVDLL